MVKIWVLLVIMIFTSCSNDIPGPSSSADSYGNNFNISPISKVSADPQATDSVFWPEVIGTSTFRFKTCIKDFAANLELPDTLFNITSGNKVVSATTEATNGCLTWHYALKFDFFKPETFYEIPITIEAIEKIQGKRQRNIAVNPWDQSLRDIEAEKNVTELLPLDLAKEQRDSGNFIVKEFQFSKNRSKKFAQILNTQYVKIIYNLNLTPLLTRIGINKNIIPIPLSKGKYLINLTLLERDSLDNKLYVVSKGSDTLYGNQARVATTVEMLHDSKRYNNTQNETMLLVELKTQGLPGGERIFNGVVPMHGISQSSEAIPDQEEYKRILSEMKSSLIANLPEENEILQLPIVEDDSNSQLQFLLSRFDIEDQKDESTAALALETQKLRRFKISGKLLNPLTENQESIKDGLFSMLVHSSDPYLQKFNPEQTLEFYPDGTYVAFIKIPYNMYDKEKYHTMEVEITGVEGQWQGASSTRQIKCNVVLHSCYPASEAPKLKEVDTPQLYVETVKYHSHIIDTNSYLLNRNMNLAFDSQFTFEVPELKFRRFKEKGVLPSLVLNGEYEVEVLIFAPKVSGPNEENINFSEYFFLTGGRTKAIVTPGGKLNFNVKFPYLISERLYNNYKNLAVMTIRPTDINSTLRPVTVTLPFYARSKVGAHLAAKTLEDLLPEEVYSEHVLKTIEEGASYKIKRMSKISPKSNLQSYRSMQDQSKLKAMSMAQFNADTNPRYKLRELHYLRASEDLEHKRTQNILTLFCHYHYKDKEKLIQRNECVKNPKDFFKLTPTFHIETLEDNQTYEMRSDAITKGNYLNKSHGRILRGQSYFAGTGVSRYQAQGKSDSKTEEFGTSLSFEMRIPLYFTMKRSESQAHSLYTSDVENQSQMSMYRSFSTLAQTFEYERLTLDFSANVIKCLKAYNDNVIYHVCNSLPKPYRIKEDWYYIGPSIAISEGVITDSTFRPTDSFAQIIRGNYNFMNQWERYLKQDNSFVIKVNDKVNISEGLLKFQEEDKYESIPMENLLDNSYPGLYIPCNVTIESKE